MVAYFKKWYSRWKPFWNQDESNDIESRKEKPSKGLDLNYEVGFLLEYSKHEHDSGGE